MSPTQPLDDFRRLDLNATAGRDLVEVEEFGEHPAEIVPHAERDRLDLGRGLFRERQGEIVQRALVPVKARGDRAPALSRPSRGKVDRQGARHGGYDKKSNIFKSVTQGSSKRPSGERSSRRDADGACLPSRPPLVNPRLRRPAGLRGAGFMLSSRPTEASPWPSRSPPHELQPPRRPGARLCSSDRLRRGRR